MTHPYRRYRLVRDDGTTVRFISIPGDVKDVRAFLRPHLTGVRAAVPVGPTQPQEEIAA